jgi:hypothetical protein
MKPEGAYDMTKAELDAIRTAVADYMKTEGCGCCQDETHRVNTNRLGKLLEAPLYPNGEDYDFTSFRSL